MLITVVVTSSVCLREKLGKVHALLSNSAKTWKLDISHPFQPLTVTKLSALKKSIFWPTLYVFLKKLIDQPSQLWQREVTREQSFEQNI